MMESQRKARNMFPINTELQGLDTAVGKKRNTTMVNQGIILTLVIVFYCTVSYGHNNLGDIYQGGASGFPGMGSGGDPNFGAGGDPGFGAGGNPTTGMSGFGGIGSFSGLGGGAGRWWCTCRHWWCRFGEWQVRNTCGLPFYPWWYKTCCKWLPWWQTTSGYRGYGGLDGFSGGMGSDPFSGNTGSIGPSFPGGRPPFGKSY